MAYSRAQARARTALGADADRRDFFHHLLAARDPDTGAPLPADELWGESNLFIIAGSDTTSTALAATLFYLAHSPADLAAAAAEVRAAFPGGPASVTSLGPALGGCAYLRACVDEAMRLAPPVPGALPRRALPGGADVDGVRVPAGVDVCVPHHALHRNPAYFPAPAAYRPARWLAPAPGDEKAAAAQLLAREAFAPFSVGPRSCIGKGLAYVELTVALARVLVEFDMRLAPGTHLGEAVADVEGGHRAEVEYRLKDTFTSVKDGPMLQFRTRGVEGGA
jgi:cytochrome P450